MPAEYKFWHKKTGPSFNTCKVWLSMAFAAITRDYIAQERSGDEQAEMLKRAGGVMRTLLGFP